MFSTFGKKLKNVYPIKPTEYGTLRVLNPPEGTTKGDQIKNNEELENMRKSKIDLRQKEVEERDREAIRLTREALWPSLTIERMIDSSIKDVEKYWLNLLSSFNTGNTND